MGGLGLRMRVPEEEEEGGGKKGGRKKVTLGVLNCFRKKGTCRCP